MTLTPIYRNAVILIAPEWRVLRVFRCASLLVSLTPSMALGQAITATPDFQVPRHWSEDVMQSLDVTGYVQQALDDLGYSISVVDGIMGDETRAAIAAFRRDHNLPDGEIDGQFLATLERVVAINQRQ